MSWTTPKTWEYKEAPGSDAFNVQIRDNLNYLKLSLPAGVIIGYGGGSAPEQWLLCDGSAISRTTYSALFSAIGTSYGAGNGSSTFNLPDYRGKVMVGKNSSDEDFDTLGETGGEKTHTLTEAEMPVHSHGVTDPGHIHSIAAQGSGEGHPVITDGTSSTCNTNSATTGISINNAGSGSAHNNLQPYLVSNFIIKY